MEITNERVKKRLRWDDEEEGRVDGIGEEVIFHTTDRVYEKFSRGEEIELEEINEVSGPLVVNNAEEGDVLKLEIVKIEITRCWSVWGKEVEASGCLAKKRALIDGKNSVRELEIDRIERTVKISERMKLPLQPMIGCIATSPPPHEEHFFGCGCSTFEPTYPHGGNMDLREMEEGTTVFLPVRAKGAQLYVGDLHAGMGRGEITWTGFEAAGVVTLRVFLLKSHPPIPYPRLLLPSSVMVFTVMDETYEMGIQRGVEMVYDYLLTSDGGALSPEEAFAFCTSQVELRFGGPAAKIILVSFPPPSSFLSS